MSSSIANEKTRASDREYVRAEEPQQTCPVCKQAFATGWSDEQDSWYYEDAQRVNIQKRTAAIAEMEKELTQEPCIKNIVWNGCITMARAQLQALTAYDGRIVHTACLPK